MHIIIHSMGLRVRKWERLTGFNQSALKGGVGDKVAVANNGWQDVLRLMTQFAKERSVSATQYERYIVSAYR